MQKASSREEDYRSVSLLLNKELFIVPPSELVWDHFITYNYTDPNFCKYYQKLTGLLN